jgi:polar amino acid transport system permease protein
VLLDDTSRLTDHRLTRAEARDWRLVAAAVGALLLLFSYALPMFGQRIRSATTVFSGGTVLEREYPVLVQGQHFGQTKRPIGEELVSVDMTTETVGVAESTGYGWMAQIVQDQAGPLQHLSMLIVMALPLVSAVVALALVGQSWWGPSGVPGALIPPSIQMAALSVLSLLLAWFHQFDFSFLLLEQSAGALMPGIGFWLAMAGSLTAAVSLFSLRNETRGDIVNWWALVLGVALLIWLLVRFRPYPYLEIWLFINDGILVTLRIVSSSFGLMLLVSLLGGLGRISSNRIIYGIASLYVEIIRGIPLLVQLLFIWFALPQVFNAVGAMLLSVPFLEGTGQWLTSLRLDPFTAAVVGLTVCYGAYGAEIFRAGISSIHRGQMEAARSLGMSYVQAMRFVILPQAARVILPPIGNEFVALLKDSSLVSVLAVSDLTRRGREYMSRTFLSFDTWIMVALCYLVLTLFSSRVVELIESKTRFER